jgi:uncharacterized membrane protein
MKEKAIIQKSCFILYQIYRIVVNMVWSVIIVPMIVDYN